MTLTTLLSDIALLLLTICLSTALTLAGHAFYTRQLRSPWLLLLITIALLSAGAFATLNQSVATPPFTLRPAALLQTAPFLAVSVLASLTCLVMAALRVRH